MIFDSHCHLNFSAFADNYREIIADCLKKGIGVVNIGSQIDTSQRALEIANEFPNDPIYASIGLHPVHTSGTEMDEEEIRFKSREENFDEKKYQVLIDGDKNHKIIAIGEIGLDYFHQPTNDLQPARLASESVAGRQTTDDWKKLQKNSLVQQLEFAQKNNLPIILHARGSKENSNDAYEDMLEILSCRDEAVPRLYQGILHCFGADREIAQKFLDLGFYLGFTGIITFKNKSVDELRAVVKMTPLDRILVETDAPYLSPEPRRGEKNTPQNVEFMAHQVASLKNVSYEQVCEQTTENFKKLFLFSTRLS